MGFVWNILLSFSNRELWDEGDDEAPDRCVALEQINALLPFGELVELVGPTYAPGVGSGMDANLYGGGFKHFDIERFIEIVEAQNWKDRAGVQLWIKGGEEGMTSDPFMLVELRQRKRSGKKPKPASSANSKGRSPAKVVKGKRPRGS